MEKIFRSKKKEREGLNKNTSTTTLGAQLEDLKTLK